jgi:hypothetical protein
LQTPQKRLKKYIIYLNLQTLLTVTKLRRLEWLGHVATMNSVRTGKKLLEGKPGGGRKMADLDEVDG